MLEHQGILYSDLQLREALGLRLLQALRALFLVLLGHRYLVRQAGLVSLLVSLLASVLVLLLVSLLASLLT